MLRFLLLSLVLLPLAAAADPATNASASRIADPDAVETALESYRQDAAGRLRISLRSSVVPAVARAFLGARKRNDGTEAPVCCLFVSVRSEDSFPIGEELAVETNGVIRYAVDLDKLNKAIETLSDNERPDPKDRVLHLFVNDMETEVGRWDLASGSDPATNAPAAESVIYVEVPDDGVHAPKDFARRFLDPLRGRLYPFARRGREPVPDALRDWTMVQNAGDGCSDYAVDRFAPSTNAPAALAALRALVAEMAPALPPGVEPVVELRERRVLRPPYGAPPEIEGEPRLGDPPPASAGGPPRVARAGVCATYLSELPPRELFPFLEREALPAAERALAAAFPDRARPVPVAVHGDTAGLRLPFGHRGGAVVAGPLALAETEAAAAALAAALAPAALPPPEGVRAPRVARLAVPADEDGGPLPPGAYEFLLGVSRAFDAAENEDRIVWLPEGAAPPGGGAWLLLAAPVSAGTPRPDADEFALEPLARLAARAGWCAPGAEPVRAFVPRTGGVVLVPLAPDAVRGGAAEADALRARAQTRAAALEESFPNGVGAVRASVRELPAGDPAATLAAVRDALFDAVSLDERRFFGDAFASGGEAWSLRAVLAAEAREAARASIPPGLAEAFPPFADRLLAALRDGDGAAFSALFDAPPATDGAPAPASLVANPFLAPFAAAAVTNAPPETVARPLDADARAALLAVLPGLAPRIDRVFLAVLRIPPESELPGSPGADPGTIAVLPCVLGDDGPRLLPSASWTFRRSPAPSGVPGWKSVLAAVDAPPAVRGPATDAFAAALLRLARAAATNEPAAIRAAEALVPPEELAAAAADAPAALRILVRELAAAVAEGPVEFRFEPVTLDARGPGHLLDRFERSPFGLALDDGGGGAVRPFTDPDPPLAARIPGAWLRILVCAPDPDGGDGAAPVATLFAILGDDGLRLRLPPSERGHRHAAGHECPPSAYRAFAARQRAGAFAGPAIRAFCRPIRAAAAALGPGRLATVSFSFLFGSIPDDFRSQWNLPGDDGSDDADDAADEPPESVLERFFHRDADRIEFIARSGLASDLNAADPRLLVDLAPGEKVRYLAATDADGTTATIEFGNPPRDPDSPRALDGGARLKYDWMTRRRDGGGGGSFGDIDLSRASFDLRGAAGRASRTVSKEDLVGRSSRTASVKDPRGPPDLAFVWTPTNAGPVLVRVAWARGTDPAANAALVEAFLADPENPAASDDLRTFQLRLVRPAPPPAP